MLSSTNFLSALGTLVSGKNKHQSGNIIGFIIYKNNNFGAEIAVHNFFSITKTLLMSESIAIRALLKEKPNIKVLSAKQAVKYICLKFQYS